MRNRNRSRVWVCFGLAALIGCMTVGASQAALFGLFKGKSEKAASAVKASSLVVFPFDQAQGVKAPEGMGVSLASALRTILVGNKQYSPLLYSDRLAPVKRAIAETTLKPKEEVGPFLEDRGKTLKVARVLAAQYFVAGSLEEVVVEASKKSAEITLSVELVDVESGKLLKALLVTGRTPDDANGTNEQDAIALAAGDAIAKLKAQLLEEPKAAPPAADNK